LSWDFQKKTHFPALSHLPIRPVENSEYEGLIKKRKEKKVSSLLKKKKNPYQETIQNCNFENVAGPAKHSLHVSIPQMA